MAIIVEQRTRATNTDPWSAWSNTNVDAVTDGTFISTDTVQYRVANIITEIPISDVTSNTQTQTDAEGNLSVTGDGYLDDLLESINLQLKAQYDSGRITGAEYAQAYIALVQTAIAQAFQFALGRRQAELNADNLHDRLTTSAKQRDVMDAQKDLYNRQRQAFDDNKYQKLFESQLNYNGIIFQDADNPDVLDVALENKVNDVFNKLTLDQPISAMPES